MKLRNARLSKIVGCALAVLVWLANTVPPVQANGCGPVQDTPTPSVTERTTAAPIVLEGIVTALSGNDAQAVAGVQVHQYLKGGGPALVYISGFHKLWTLYDCADWVNVGDHLIFYAVRVPADGKLHTFVLGARGSTTPASSDYLSEAMRVAGQGPVTPDPQTEIPPSTETPAPSAAKASRAVAPSSSTLVTLALIFSGLTGTLAIILLGRELYAQSRKSR